MNRFFPIILLLGALAHHSYAQTDELDSLELSNSTSLMTYLSFTSPFEKYNSLDIGISKPTRDGNALGMEIGYIYDIAGLNSAVADSWYQKTYGAKAYFYYRIIILENDPYPFNSQLFIDIEPQFFWASFESERIAGYSCNEAWGDCEYYRFFESRVDRIIPGINFKVGKIYQYERLNFILFAGMGISHIIELSGIMTDPAPDKIFNRNGSESNLQTGTSLKLRVGFQIAYQFWKP